MVGLSSRDRVMFEYLSDEAIVTRIDQHIYGIYRINDIRIYTKIVINVV